MLKQDCPLCLAVRAAGGAAQEKLVLHDAMGGETFARFAYCGACVKVFQVVEKGQTVRGIMLGVGA